jgi:hypothetical protein
VRRPRMLCLSKIPARPAGPQQSQTLTPSQRGCVKALLLSIQLDKAATRIWCSHALLIKTSVLQIAPLRGSEA